MSLLEMSFSGAILILVIVIIRALTINKLPKRTFLAQWGIALFRLLIPFTMPASFSVYSLAAHFAPIYSLTDEISKNNISYLPSSENVAAIPMASTVSQTLYSIWMILWLIGMLICTFTFALLYVKCHCEFKTSLPLRNDYTKKWLREHQIFRTVEIRQSDKISTPLTYGIVHPVILIPKTIYRADSASLDYILTHEYVHIRRFDTMTKLILTLTVCIHWFNPIVWVMYILVNRDIELSCDEAVIRLFGESTKSTYAMTIIRMAEIKSGITPLCSNFSKNAIEERIVAIMKIKKSTIWTMILAFGLVIGTSVVFMTTAKAENHPVGGSALEIPTAWEDNTAQNKSMAYQLSKCKEFSKYEKLGLSYDSNTEHLIYNEQTVGYFKDEFFWNKYTRFVDETGEIGVSIRRDENWNIIGIEQFPMSEVYYGEGILLENNAIEGNAVTTAFASEEGGNYIPDKEYINAGLEWNDDIHAWFYNGKFVADLYDNGGIYTCDTKSDNDVTYIEVIRNKRGAIENINEISKEKLQELILGN